ncbi:MULTISPECIES: hypothetical protein [Bosea]|uniref:hypothetical protein n=1 Tax=Bosea TaxID=85413 RepID=UPI00214F7E74|nr:MULTISPECIES: hypothetical protein [Bosea]MCR4519959.1 hypothetical protein [Bosea sp. 47.2.35]MDR6828795.1 hypothetical protein [Bosea robiniae]MDR6895791.1 hypothetical protein [Bosea sp. BE109]MDR7139187.1 hypothetical protein [Bosea sp. BE168]MDR7175775.1 hypothetical protein [Bosea sp. BE271]
MKRAAFFLLFHAAMAFLAVAVILGLADLAGWQGSRIWPIGLAALILTRPVHALAEQAWARWLA